MQINDKAVKLAILDYNLRKERIDNDEMTETEIEQRRMPLAQAIDNLRLSESEVVKEINYSQSELFHSFQFDDY